MGLAYAASLRIGLELDLDLSSTTHDALNRLGRNSPSLFVIFAVMDPLTAFSVAVNVMQVISFSHETISLCKRLHRDGQSNPELTHHVSHLSNISTNLQTSIKDAEKQSGPLSQQEKELQAVANGCYRASTALQTQLAKLANPTVGSPRAAFRATWKTVWGKSELERLEKTLNANQRLLETKLLERLYVNIVSTNRSIDSLDKETKYFIAQYKNGHRQIARLIQDQGEAVKAHVTTESQSLRRDLVVKLDNFKLTDTNQALTQRILDSLRDRDSNLRRNQITESHEGTFGWIFERNTTKSWDGFVEWLESDSRLYWINGKPGSGKSTLMKFLINEARTQVALDRWQPGCMILSAFLWKSGQQIQRTRTGLLSSLIHQLLGARTGAAMELISVHPNVASRTSLSDWSVVDLTLVLTDLLSRSDKYVCIFIDGLDEIGPEDDAHDLVMLVTTIKTQPKVKLCVSSRPERPFQRAFNASSKLRLQDLTASDIDIHITDSIQSCFDQIAIHDYPGDAVRDLTDIIAPRADGVFLWVEIVLRSVRTGLINGDRWDEMLQRLQLLPRSLDELYNQMWLRLNEDEPIYRQEAAFYFNAVIDFDTFVDRFDTFVDWSYFERRWFRRRLFDSRDFNSRVSTMLAMSMGANPTLVSTILDSRLYVSPDVVAKLCIQTVNHIQVRSAGLLELSTDDISRDENESLDDPTDLAQVLSELPKRPMRDQLGVLLKLKVSFIHRTVRDFLLETGKGRDILRNDEVSTHSRGIRYLRAIVAGAVAFKSTVTAGVYGFELKKYFDVVRNLKDFVSSSREENLQRKEFVDLLLDLFENNALTTTLPKGFDLLGLMVSYGFDDVVIPALVKLEENGTLPTDYCDYLLSCASNWYNPNFQHSSRVPSMLGVKGIVDWLLKRGANSNAKMHWPVLDLIKPTPFAIFLGNTWPWLGLALPKEQQILHELYHWYVGIVRSFIDAGASLDSVGYVVHAEMYGMDTPYSLPPPWYDSAENLVPIFLSKTNAAYSIGKTLETCHNADTELSNSQDIEKFAAAKKFGRVELAAVYQKNSSWTCIENAPFRRLVVISEEDFLALTDLLEGDWRKDPGGRNPFEKRDFEGILQRGRPVDYRDYMENAGVLWPRAREQEEFPPRIPGKPPRKEYTVLDADSQEEYPLHTWFLDRSPKEHEK